VVVDFKESRIVDMSAIDALNKLSQRYRQQGKTLFLRHLSEDCRKMLKNAEAVVEVNIQDDPTYKVMPEK
jgi:SulP family sulfate permease